MRRVELSLAAHGLLVRGGFDFDPADERPAGVSGAPARSVVLVGSAGDDWWRYFESWVAAQPTLPEHPLDTWSRAVMGPIADEAGARLVMPNDRPYAPFQQWAIRAEGLKPSPLGILMHPVYGLWHAYRAALLFDRPLALADGRLAHASIHLCDACVGKPCLKACPVDAHSAAGFAYRACVEHVESAWGAPCRDGGCFDRNACPYGVEYRYQPAVQRFLMKAFIRGANEPSPQM